MRNRYCGAYGNVQKRDRERKRGLAASRNVPKTRAQRFSIRGLFITSGSIVPLTHLLGINVCTVTVGSSSSLTMASSSSTTCLADTQKAGRCTKPGKKDLVKIDFMKTNKEKIMDELCGIHKNYLDRQV